jgi:hypothetical protein
LMAVFDGAAMHRNNRVLCAMIMNDIDWTGRAALGQWLPEGP